MIRNSASVILLYLLALPVAVATGANQQRINIQADTMTMEVSSGNSIYEGNVRFERQDIVLSGDMIKLERDDAGSMQVQVIGAPARYHQTSGNNPTKAQSQRMDFDDRTDVLTMNKDARLEHDGQLIESDHIEYDTTRKVLLAGGKKADDKKRVNIILNQQSEQP